MMFVSVGCAVSVVSVDIGTGVLDTIITAVSGPTVSFGVPAGGVGVIVAVVADAVAEASPRWSMSSSDDSRVITAVVAAVDIPSSEE